MWPHSIYIISAPKCQIVHKSWRDIWRVRSSRRGCSCFGLSALLRSTEKLTKSSGRGHGNHDGIIVDHRTTIFTLHQGTFTQYKV